MASIRLDASRSSLPKAWVKAPARSFQPCSRMAARISSRAAAQPRHPVFGAELRGQGDRAVERHPAHQLGVQEVPRLAADLPDALVLFPPSAGRGVRGGGQEPPGDRVELAELVDQPVGGAEQFAVDVELPLAARRRCRPGPGRLPRQPARCGSSRSERSRSPPMPNMICRSTAALQLGGGGVGQECEELAGLVRAGRHPQRLHGQAGVAHPGVAVVPVALAADGLRQRGGRRGDDRAGRLRTSAPAAPGRNGARAPATGPRSSGGWPTRSASPSTVSSRRAVIFVRGPGGQRRPGRSARGRARSTAAWPAVRRSRPVAVAPSTSRPTGVDSSSRSAPPRAVSPPATGVQDRLDRGRTPAGARS